MENYLVALNRPFTAAFERGAVMGYNIPDTSTPERFFYWDGNDYWVDAATDITAVFKGTLKFYPTGSNLHPDFESQDYYPEPLHLIGDALVLSLWPQDYLKLNELLPEGSPLPRQLIYQNVDRLACLENARSLIMSNKEYYKPIFRREPENDISDSELENRAQAWLNTAWSIGEGNGILIQSGDIIGTTSAGHPVSTDESINNTLVPAGSSGRRRLTLKCCNERGIYFSPSFLFYLLSNTTNDQLAKTWGGEDVFIQDSLSYINSLPKFRIFYHTDAEHDVPVDIPEDAISVYPDTQAWIFNEHINRKIPAMFDQYASESFGHWRMQGWPPVGVYQIQAVPSHSSTPPTLEEHTYQGLTISIGPGGVFITDESLVFVPVDIRSQWLRFGRRHKFVLGVNMETLRRQHSHDLSGNSLLVRRNSATGGYERIHTMENAWLSGNPSANTIALLEEDFRAIKATGVSCVRIWVFELLEGIEFGFSQAVDDLRRSADNNITGVGSILHTRVFPPGNQIVHACSKREFESFFNPLTSQKVARLISGTYINANGTSITGTIIEKAKIIRRIANENGVRILWTLFTHYKAFRDVPCPIYPTVIRACASRSIQRRPLSLVDNSQEWKNYYEDITTGDNEGRLPVEAWIYRAAFTDATLRTSMMDIVSNFVSEIVDDTETTLGFEIMNKSDILCDDCSVGWTTEHFRGGDRYWQIVEYPAGTLNYGITPRPWQMSGVRLDPGLMETGWKLTRGELNSFLGDCLSAIRRVSRTLLVTSGVLGQADDHTLAELRHISSLPIDFSSIARNAASNAWQGAYDVGDHTFGEASSHPHQYTGFSGASANGKLLFSEAGYKHVASSSTPKLSQRNAVKEALKACIRLGYAGMFIWHYDDPGRSAENWRNDSLTAYSGDHDSDIFTPPGTTISMRPAAQEIIDFAASFSSILLPQTR